MNFGVFYSQGFQVHDIIWYTGFTSNAVLGHQVHSLGLPSLIGVVLLNNRFSPGNWCLIHLVSTHLADGTEAVPGPRRNGGFFVVLPILQTPNLAGAVGTFCADSVRNRV